jgi:FtsP/CotA-like multicopper oxidase with cupredoxin domain
MAPVVARAQSSILAQCPADTDGIDTDGDGSIYNDHRCVHLSGGDGFVTMADGQPLYIFSFAKLAETTSNASNGSIDPAFFLNEHQVMERGRLAANFPAPLIVLKEGQKFFLTLTNVGMMVRPDLFDEHTVHFHGFPNAAPVFDGVPDSSISIGMGASITYYYNIVEPGTYMYHCHVEATEHMQMGMLGNLYVQPKKNNVAHGKFAYNDTDNSTAYDVEYPIQIGGFDPNFHNASYGVQPLPFADMHDKYPMLNGRGYPDTANGSALGTLPGDVAGWQVKPNTQPLPTRIEAAPGDKILLRISNLNITQFNTLATTLGVPMKVVGRDARWLSTANYFDTQTVTLGGGQSYDVILDTTNVAPGTYVLYTTNLQNLSNNQQDFGGMMTEIHIGAGGL